jgi:PKD repeat protein
LTVNNVVPVVVAGTDQIVNEGDLVYLDPSTFNDKGTLDTHTATINWGDGTSTEAGTVSESPFGPPGSTSGMDGAVSGSHVYADNGIYTGTVTVTDDDGAVDSDTIILTVNNVAPTVVAGTDQTVNEGDMVSLNPATFNDKGTLDTHTATINWGDGTSTEAGTVSESPFGPPGSTAGMDGTVSGSHVYADNGVYTVNVTVTDDDGGVDSDTIILTVHNVAPTVMAGADQTVNEGDVVNLDPATFNDKGTLDTHVATVSWGDGSALDVGIVSESPFGPPGDTAGADATVSKSHAYGDNGVYTVTVTVADDDGAISSDTFIVTVNNVAPSTVIDGIKTPLPDALPHLILPTEVITFHGSFTDPGWLDTHSATWNFGDSTIDVGVLIEENVQPDSTGTITGNHAYANPGSYTVTLTVKDDDGGVGLATIVIKVSDPKEIIEEFKEYFDDLDDDAFNKNPDQRKKTLSNKLDAVFDLIDEGEYEEAANKLEHDIKAKMDGDTTPKDWIIDPTSQEEVMAVIDTIIAWLESKL